MRTWQFAVFLLLAVAGNLFLENKEVRRDLSDMADVYSGFLKRKAGGKPMGSIIRPDSLAVFKAGSQTVACALMP